MLAYNFYNKKWEFNLWLPIGLMFVSIFSIFLYSVIQISLFEIGTISSSSSHWHQSIFLIKLGFFFETLASWYSNFSQLALESLIDGKVSIVLLLSASIGNKSLLSSYFLFFKVCLVSSCWVKIVSLPRISSA